MNTTTPPPPASTAPPADAPARTPPAGRARLAATAGLLVLAPICGEHLIGYDSSIGRPLDLLASLLFFIPLYGTVAVLIREAVRRRGGGPLALVALAAAFGLAQAGLIDQSLFDPHVTGDPAYDDDRTHTLIPGTGLAAHPLLNYVAGHVIWTFTAPIVVIESLAPRIADRPWVHRRGLLTLGAFYLAAAALIHSDTGDVDVSPAQLAATATAVLLLAAAALIRPKRRTPRTRPPALSPPALPPPTPPSEAELVRARWRRTWGPRLLAAAALTTFTTHQLLPPTWAGTLADLAILTTVVALLHRATRQHHRHHRTSSQGRRRALTVAGAALTVNAALSFVVDPIGTVSYPAKYAANATLTVTVLLLLAAAHHQLTRADPADPPPGAPREQ
ncbi:hypothetical protein CC117_22605 [Parafrankia colletiae]|uniref:Uncharacterized protein n=1 Tax=Parafrankia colletiae TaxID=573497 RepID=A0A1S1QMA8_9ACTN|nr:hypothetical protein CC117_22605 [Parafrankia colletiae]